MGRRRGVRVLVVVLACTAAVAAGGVPLAAQPAGLIPAPTGCIDDGRSGPRVQIVFGAVEGEDNHDEFLRRAPRWAELMDAMVNTSADRFGESMRIRYLQDDACEPLLTSVDLPPEVADDADAIDAHLVQIGFFEPGRRLVVFVDTPDPSPDACGVGGGAADELPASLDNPRADPRQQTAATVWHNCWLHHTDEGAAFVALHELMHTFGVMTATSPNSDGQGHCLDGRDLMCQDRTDGGCTEDLAGYLLDCNGDDYFNPHPAPGSWLDTHFNTWWLPWFTPVSGPRTRIDRVQGATRYETAAAAVERLGPPDGSGVFLVTGANFADSLAAGPIASRFDIPLLLTAPSGIPPATADQLRRLQPDEVVLIGGEAALPEAIAEEARAILPDAEVGRRAGTGRVETAADIASTAGDAATIVLADGGSYTSALVGASVAGRLDGLLLLTAGGAIPPVTADQLVEKAPSRIVVVGTQAEVGAVVEQARAYAPEVTPLLADDPTLLSLDAVDASNPGGTGVLQLASREDFPDALAASQIAQPLVLVPRDGPTPPGILERMEAYGTRGVLVYGGDLAIAPSVVAGFE